MAERDLDLYTDYYGPTEIRRRQAAKDFRLLLGNHTVTGILELGPGNGETTQALRETHPYVPIAVMDRDSQSLAAATQSVIANEIIDGDAWNISPEFIDSLNGVNTIVAMRMPGELILHVLNVLKQSQFQGRFVSSVLALNYEHDALRQLAHQPQVQKVILREEPHQVPEYGYVAEFA